MPERDPYCPPRAILLDTPLPARFAGGDWAPGQLRVLAALSLACLLGLGVLLALRLWLAIHPQFAPLPFVHLLGLLMVLLWGYLLLRLRALLHDRFALRGLDWPLAVQILAGLLLAGVGALLDEPQLAWVALFKLGHFALFVVLGLSQAWFALRLWRLRHGWPALRLLAALLLLGGIGCASVLLLVPALLLGLGAAAALAWVFFTAAGELGAAGQA